MTALPWHRAVLQKLLADRSHFPHALLIHGPSGTGKAEFARALAASALCEAPQAGLACGACPSCHWFSQGNHPDFREIVPEAIADEEGDVPEAAAGQVEGAKAEKARSLLIKIDQIRALADFVSLTTHRAGFRVLVMRPAEAMQPAAANALLKTLEEPAPATIIALVSDRPARLLATIRSRCRKLALPMPPRDVALAWLRAQGIANAESALAIAGGAPLLAVELAQPEEEILRRRLVGELARPGGADPLAFATAIDRNSVERTIHWMQTWIQDLVRVKMGGEVRHHAEHLAALHAKAKSAEVEALFAFDRELASARSLAAHPLNPRLVTEHLLMAYNRATSARSP
ncbi:MAG: DNA polymerase III subunit delta' [Usitatibacter sp.]